MPECLAPAPQSSFHCVRFFFFPKREPQRPRRASSPTSPATTGACRPGSRRARTAASSRKRRRRAFDVNVRVADFTWRQLQPTQGSFSQTTADSVYGMTFASWNTQLAGSDPIWLRLWVSGDDWAPQWVKTLCGVSAGWDRLRERRSPADLERLLLAAGARALPPGAGRARPARRSATEVPLRPRRLHLVRVRLRHPDPGGGRASASPSPPSTAGSSRRCRTWSTS